MVVHSFINPLLQQTYLLQSPLSLMSYRPLVDSQQPNMENSSPRQKLQTSQQQLTRKISQPNSLQLSNGVISINPSHNNQRQKEQIVGLFKELISIANKNFNQIADNQQLRQQRIGFRNGTFANQQLTNLTTDNTLKELSVIKVNAVKGVDGTPILKKVKSSRVAKKVMKEQQASSDPYLAKGSQPIYKRSFYHNSNHEAQQSSQYKVVEHKNVVDLSTRLKEEIFGNYQLVLQYQFLKEHQSEIQGEEPKVSIGQQL